MVEKTEARARILEAAAAAFGELGFAGARVDDIAARAGVNKATVYYHIGGKEQLYATVVGEVLDRAMETLATSLEEASKPEDQFRAVINTLVTTASRFPHFAPLMLREVAGGGSSLPDDVLKRMASLLGVVADVLRHGAEEGSFRIVDPLVTHMMVAGSTFFLIAGAPLRSRMRAIAGTKAVSRETTPAALSDLIASLIIDGLSSRSATKGDGRAGKRRTKR